MLRFYTGKLCAKFYKKLLYFSIVGVIHVATCSYAQTSVRAEEKRSKDPEKVAVSQQVISLDLYEVPLDKALEEIAHLFETGLLINPEILPKKKVTLQLKSATLQETLNQILHGTPVEGFLSNSGNIMLREQGTLTPQEIVRGTITDASSGEPLPGVNVLVKGTSQGTVTDIDGNYSLNVPDNAVALVFSFVGYQTQEVPLNDRSTLNIQMTEDAQSLDEVVVTATGDRKRKELGNVIAKIDASSIVPKTSINNFEGLLAGRIPGVQISSFTGSTGMSSRIRIRGLSSISLSRDPLIIVDGIRVNNNPSSTSTGLTGNEGFMRYTSGGINDINPQEIESIEVIKGPSASTLYGTDAVNGVIIIKTKKGFYGEQRWNFYGETGILEPSVHFGDNYFSWGRNLETGEVGRCTLQEIAAGTCIVDSLTSFNPLNDEETTPIKTGNRVKIGLQTSGGNDKVAYFISGDFESENHYLKMPSSEISRLEEERQSSIPDEQIRPNALQKLNFRTNLTANIGEKATLNISNGLVFKEVRLPIRGIWYTYVSSLWSLGYKDPIYNGWAPRYGRPGDLYSEQATENVVHYTGSINGDWQPISWLTGRGIIGVDYTNSNFNGLKRRGQGVGVQNGEKINVRTNTTLISADFSLTSNFELTENIGSRSSIGGQYNSRLDQVTSVRALGLAPGGEIVNGSEQLTSEEGYQESVVAGVFAEQSFSFKEKLFVIGGLRIDGAGSFGNNFNTAVYPKVSLSWLTSEEPFMSNFNWVNNLRLRTAYGASGVQPGSTFALDLLNLFTSYVDNSKTSGAALSQLGNPDLKPEKSTEFEAGFDLALFSNRISLEATYYDKVSKDALLPRPLPSSVGLSSQWINVGSVRNYGFEIALSTKIVETKPVNINLDFVGSINENRLEKLGIPNVDFIGSILSRSIEGYPIFSRWSRPIESYSDSNSNGIIERDEVVVGDEIVYLGPSLPTKQLSISPTISFFNNTLSFFSLFDYNGGHVGYNSGQEVADIEFNVSRAVNDPSAPLGDQARAVAAAFYGTSAGYFEDASFLRWREASLSYELPQAFINRIGVRRVNLVLTGRNLFLWSGFSYPDPETSNSIGDNSVEGNNSVATMPQTRYWLVRLNVSF